MDIAKTLSLSFVMIAGPQILSSIFLATTKKWSQNSLAFIAGAATSVTLITTAAFLLSSGASSNGTSSNTLSYIILILLVAAAIHTFVSRKTSKPPKWMGKLEEAQPKGSYKLGFLLLGVFPSDILTSISVGAFMAAQGEPWVQILPFVFLVLLFLALPLILIVLLGKRAEAFLPKARDWMNNNSWIVSEIVFAMFIALVYSGLN
ncbi:MAG TPA: GAP family protein [Candidatus Binatia bacterium]|nr:GAP family protein [Candidatus Binatia bacterium]